MKIILIALLCLLVSSAASAENIKAGVFGSNIYYLQTESVRFCSTLSCLYVAGHDQPYIGATFIVEPINKPSVAEDVFSYTRTPGFELKKVLFSRDGQRIVLLETVKFDANGNQSEPAKNETVERIKYESTTATETRDNKGNVSVSRDTIEINQRKDILWRSVAPGTDTDSIVRYIMSFAESNYYDIIARSKAENSMSVK